MATTDQRSRCGSGFVQIDVNKDINGEALIGCDPLPSTPFDSCEQASEKPGFLTPMNEWHGANDQSRHTQARNEVWLILAR
ncbi:hypothetical protein [Synechococcus sp. UW105]|uniref:hypothetical protein n=1 Tax=Synechococcus sp. UW105 TaxID=337067 RepID=UPI0010BDE83C|nr:hypothetical protein [Synechococcus sp. UW105]